MKRTAELILYRNPAEGRILKKMAWIMEHDQEEKHLEKLRNQFYECTHELIDLAGTYGFEGNLWHAYLTYLLVNYENVFSMSCEMRELGDGSLMDLARHDFEIFREPVFLRFPGPGGKTQGQDF